MKESRDTFTCDLCKDIAQVPAGKFPIDWAKVEYEPVDRTFVEKHVCGMCASKIKYKDKK